jgi:chromosome segregation ATPase
MPEVKFGELRSVVEAVRQIVLDWDGFVANVEALGREHDEQREQAERLALELGDLREAHDQLGQERRHVEETLGRLRTELGELRQAHGQLGREHADAQQALATLGATAEALRGERERLARELAELRDRYAAVMHERRRASEELEAVLDRLRVPA